ncbi:PP2C family protein-serine/threonine phosphatase [Streptomyces sp. L7]
MAATFLGTRRTLLVCCWTVLLALAAGLRFGGTAERRFRRPLGRAAPRLRVQRVTARQRGRLRERLAEARGGPDRPGGDPAAGLPHPLRHPCQHPLPLRAPRVLGRRRPVRPRGDARTRLRVLVGDARGHGLDALRTAADTLAGFRELVYTAPDLTSLAKALDARLTPGLGPEDFVTAVLAEFGPGEVRLVNCGHPAPLRSGQRLELLEPRVPALPLGLCPDPRQYRVRLQPGDRLLLYTDGLTESCALDGTPFALLYRVRNGSERTDAGRALHAPVRPPARPRRRPARRRPGPRSVPADGSDGAGAGLEAFDASGGRPRISPTC